MQYSNITQAEFIRRPNRFIAWVRIGNREECVHVKNTGRCQELLVPGCEVYLHEPAGGQRKTRYDLVAVRKADGRLVNMDSQAPNHAVREWLQRQGFPVIQSETVYGSSRLDFYFERHPDSADAPILRCLMEVKGCTLIRDGIGYFPDAPTERGVRHLQELARAAGEGYLTYLAFVIQTDGVAEVRPNTETQPAFAAALKEAREAGVTILPLRCHVEPDLLHILPGQEL